MRAENIGREKLIFYLAFDYYELVKSEPRSQGLSLSLLLEKERGREGIEEVGPWEPGWSRAVQIYFYLNLFSNIQNFFQLQ